MTEDDDDDDLLECVVCGNADSKMHTCDETGDAYCDTCWHGTPCAQGDHDEGCETVVWQ